MSHRDEHVWNNLFVVSLVVAVESRYRIYLGDFAEEVQTGSLNTSATLGE